MTDELPSSTEGSLPTLSEKVAEWLGFQLPAIPMPQSMKNLDKAVSKILLAAGENVEARIKANTGHAKTKGKIAIEGLYRTEEEKRKIENRAAIVKVAVDEMNESPHDAEAGADAKAEIDDDWLNLFARLAEDKTSEELQGLFGRILAGEIRKPGSFSLRTIQFISTLSKEDAHSVSTFLSFALAKRFIPSFQRENAGPDIETRVTMQELGLASHPSTIGGLVWNVQVMPNQKQLLPGSGFGILVQNNTHHFVELGIECQVLTTPAKELIEIANPPPTNLQYLKDLSKNIFEKINTNHSEELLSGKIEVLVVSLVHVGQETYRYVQVHKAS